MSFQEFQKAPNRWTFRDILYLAVVIVVVLLVLSALGAVNYYLAGILPDGGEFHLLRTGGRGFLFDRVEPYSGTVPQIVQEQVYGRGAAPGEDLYILDIPFHLVLFFFPLALFPDALMARAFWMALTQVALFGFLYYSFRILRRQVSTLFSVVIFVACFISPYAYLSFIEGSPTILLSLAYLGILLAMRSGLDELAGGLIVLSGFQWEVGGPFLIFILLMVIWERRWRVFIGAAMLSFVLFVITFFIYPGWILPFMRAAWNSIRVGFGYSTHEILAQLWPEYGSTLGWVLTAVLVVLLGYEWGTARGANFRRVIWAICVTFVVTPLLGWRLEIDHFVLLTLPVMMIVIVSLERWRKMGAGIAVLLILFFFGLPWYVYTQGLPFEIGLSVDESLFLFWPLFAFIGLYWMRWWIIRPPRTWMDTLAQRDE